MSLLVFNPSLRSLLPFHAVLCHSSKAMLLVIILPQQGLNWVLICLIFLSYICNLFNGMFFAYLWIMYKEILFATRRHVTSCHVIQTFYN